MCRPEEPVSKLQSTTKELVVAVSTAMFLIACLITLECLDAEEDRSPSQQVAKMCLSEEQIWSHPSTMMDWFVSSFTFVLYATVQFNLMIIKAFKEGIDALFPFLLQKFYNWFYFIMAMLFLVLVVIQPALSVRICQYTKQKVHDAQANALLGGDDQAQANANAQLHGPAVGQRQREANNTPKCDICFEPFATDPAQPHAPVAGICGHWFCRSCLDTYAGRPDWVLAQPDTPLGVGIIRLLEQHNVLPVPNQGQRQQQEQLQRQQQQILGHIRCFKCQKYSFPIPVEGSFRALYGMCDHIADFQQLAADFQQLAADFQQQALKAEVGKLDSTDKMISVVLTPLLFLCFLVCLGKQDIVSSNRQLSFSDIIYVTFTTATCLVLLTPIWSMFRNFLPHTYNGINVHPFQLFISLVVYVVLFAYAFTWVMLSPQEKMTPLQAEVVDVEDSYAF